MLDNLEAMAGDAPVVGAAALGREYLRLLSRYWGRISLQSLLALVIMLGVIFVVGIFVAIVNWDGETIGEAGENAAFMLPIGFLSCFFTAYILGHVLLNETSVAAPSNREKRQFAYTGVFWMLLYGLVTALGGEKDEVSLNTLEYWVDFLPMFVLEVVVLLLMANACIKKAAFQNIVSDRAVSLWENRRLFGCFMVCFFLLNGVFSVSVDMVGASVFLENDRSSEFSDVTTLALLVVFAGLFSILYYLFVVPAFAALWLVQSGSERQENEVKAIFS